MRLVGYIHAVLTGRLATWNDRNDAVLRALLDLPGSRQGSLTFDSRDPIATARVLMDRLLSPVLGRDRVLGWDIKAIDVQTHARLYGCLLAAITYVESIRLPSSAAREFRHWFNAVSAGMPVARELLQNLDGADDFDLWIVARRLLEALNEARGEAAAIDVRVVFQLAVVLGAGLQSSAREEGRADQTLEGS